VAVQQIGKPHLEISLPSPLAFVSRARKPKIRHLIVLMLASLFLTGTLNAQMDEYSIKAAYLYNFSKYVEWPGVTGEEAHTSFVICIVGEDPFGDILNQAVSGKTSGDGRVLEVRRLKAIDPPSLRKCEMVFISVSEKSHAMAIREALKASPVFTVADFSPFAENGGIANLRIDGNKVRVDLNINAANQVNLKISGKLQQVANLVK
jgi:hypothetical protein